MGLLNFFRKKETEEASPQDAPESSEKPETESLSTVNTEPPDAAVPPEASAEPAPDPPGDGGAPVDPKTVEEGIVENLKTIYDPEIPVNIYELGLIYDVDVNADGLVGIRMTLTSPGCPAAQTLPGEVKAKAKAVPGVSDAWVDVVWEPQWYMNKMTDAAKLKLGLL